MTGHPTGLTDVRDRYIAQVVPGRSFVDVGGLHEIAKQRFAIAHAHGAAELALIDMESSDHAVWEEMRRHLAAQGIAHCRFISSDIRRGSTECFDVAYSSGILNHVPSPVHYLDMLRRIAREHVVLASSIVPERITGPVDIVCPPGSMLYLPGVPSERRAQVSDFFAQHGRPDIFANAANPLHDAYGVYWLPTAGALVAMCRDVGYDVLDHGPIENDALLGYALLLRVPKGVPASTIDPPHAVAAVGSAESALSDRMKADWDARAREDARKVGPACVDPVEFWHRRVLEVLTETGEMDNPWVAPHARRYAFSIAELARLDAERNVAFEIGLTKLFPFLLTSDLGYRRIFGTHFAPGPVQQQMQEIENVIFGQRVRATAFNIDLERDRIPMADASVDLVLCCEVLEHMDIDPMFMLAEINRITKPGGHLFLTTPNISSARAVWKILNGYAPHFFMQYQKDRSPHRHNYEHDIHSLQTLTRAAGFETRMLKTIDVFEAPEPRGLLALDRLGMTTAFRGDDIFFIGRKVGAVADRWPAAMYV